MQWTLLYKQTAPYYYTAGLNALQTTQLNTSSDANYSILNKLYNSSTRSDYEISSGRYRFKYKDSNGKYCDEPKKTCHKNALKKV